MLGGAGLPRFGNEQTYFLIGSSPLRIQLAVVAEGHLRREASAVTMARRGPAPALQGETLTRVHRT